MNNITPEQKEQLIQLGYDQESIDAIQKLDEDTRNELLINLLDENDANVLLGNEKIDKIDEIEEKTIGINIMRNFEENFENKYKRIGTIYNLKKIERDDFMNSHINLKHIDHFFQSEYSIDQFDFQNNVHWKLFCIYIAEETYGNKGKEELNNIFKKEKNEAFEVLNNYYNTLIGLYNSPKKIRKIMDKEMLGKENINMGLSDLFHILPQEKNLIELRKKSFSKGKKEIDYDDSLDWILFCKEFTKNSFYSATAKRRFKAKLQEMEETARINKEIRERQENAKKKKEAFKQNFGSEFQNIGDLYNLSLKEREIFSSKIYEEYGIGFNDAYTIFLSEYKQEKPIVMFNYLNQEDWRVFCKLISKGKFGDKGEKELNEIFENEINFALDYLKDKYRNIEEFYQLRYEGKFLIDKEMESNRNINMGLNDLFYKLSDSGKDKGKKEFDYNISGNWDNLSILIAKKIHGVEGKTKLEEFIKAKELKKVAIKEKKKENKEKLIKYTKQDWVDYLKQRYENISTLYKLDIEERKSWNDKMKEESSYGLAIINKTFQGQTIFNYKDQEKWRSFCYSVVIDTYGEEDKEKLDKIFENEIQSALNHLKDQFPTLESLYNLNIEDKNKLTKETQSNNDIKMSLSNLFKKLYLESNGKNTNKMFNYQSSSDWKTFCILVAMKIYGKDKEETKEIFKKENDTKEREKQEEERRKIERDEAEKKRLTEKAKKYPEFIIDEYPSIIDLYDEPKDKIEFLNKRMISDGYPSLNSLYNKINSKGNKRFNYKKNEEWEEFCLLIAKEIYGQDGYEQLKEKIGQNKKDAVIFLKSTNIKNIKTKNRTILNGKINKKYKLSLSQLFKKLKQDGVNFEELPGNRTSFSFILDAHWKIFCEGINKIQIEI